MFFSDPKNFSIINSAVDFLNNYETKDEAIDERVEVIIKILNFIKSASDYWDKNCIFNIDSIGTSYMNHLSKIYSSDIDNKLINDVFIMSYRFLLEYNLNTPRKLDVKFQNILTRIYDEISSDGIYSELKSDLIYATYLMPSDIISKMIKSEEIQSFKKFSETHEKAISEQKNWKDYIHEQKKETTKILEVLKKYETAFNFVGLQKGFKDLRTSKTKEESFSLAFLFLLAALIILVPVLEVYYIWSNTGKIEQLRDIILISFFPIATIEILLIYFFRVFLHNFKSIKSQLLQIDLRMTLCQFIQSYADYSVEIKAKNGASLEKFEQIIFSGIVASDDDLPSTYDGITQLTNLLGKIKKT